MKIGMLCHSTCGGSGIVATRLGQELARRGHEIHFICSERPFRLSEFQTNVYLHPVGNYNYPLFDTSPYFLLHINKIVDVARGCNLDLIHAHYAIPHTMSAYMALQILGKKLPLVTTLHGTDISLVGKHPDFYETTRFSLSVSDRVTAVSDWLRNETRKVFSLNNDIDVIHNFINPGEYCRMEDPELRLRFARPHEKILIHISNFRKVKRVEDVIEIFARVAARVPAKLLMVGDGPGMFSAQKSVMSKNLNQQVYFLGKQDYVVPLLSIADLLLMPSEKESFGLAALEAMSCEVPVVASGVGGLTEVIPDGEAGFLVPVGAVEEMSQRACYILSSREITKKFGHRGRRHILENFTQNQKVGQYEKIYINVLNNP